MRFHVIAAATLFAALLAGAPAAASTVSVSGSVDWLDTVSCGPILPWATCNVGLDLWDPAAAGSFSLLADVTAPALPDGSTLETATLAFDAEAGPSGLFGDFYVSTTSVLEQIGVSTWNCTDPQYYGYAFTGRSLGKGAVSFVPCQSPGAEYEFEFSGINSIENDGPAPLGPYDVILLGEDVNYTLTEYYLAPGEAPEPSSFAWIIGGIGTLLWTVRFRSRESKNLF